VKASAFAYHDPRTCGDLIGLIATLDNAKLLAGGQSLMPMLNLVTPDHLIAPPITMHPVSPEQILEWNNKTKT
jgi:CO/xanthine dehydrogenase FAD-binding subunit